MSSYEDRFLSKLDAKRWNEQTPFLRTAHERARKVLSEDEINIDEFTDRYDKNVIDADKAYVQKRMRSFAPEDETSQRAQILEAIMLEQVELSDWFGQNAMTRKTSKFDDIARGVDMFIRFNPTHQDEQAQILGFAADATFSPAGTEHKIARAFDRERTGKLNSVKYYADEDGHRDEVQMPLVVLGMQASMLDEIGLLWVNNKKKELGNHPIQHTLLAQAQLQLRGMRDVAMDMKNAELERLIAGPLSIIEEELKRRPGVQIIKDDIWKAMEGSVRRLSSRQ